MIRKYKLEDTNETYLRIWQKVNFGKEFLESGFFQVVDIPKSDNSVKLSVFQFDPNTRLFYLGNTLYWVTSEETIYNYLDTGRAVSILSDRYRVNKLPGFYFYNELNITDNEIKGFEDYKDKENLNLKVIAELDNEKMYLIYKEDLAKIKTRLEEIKAEVTAIDPGKEKLIADILAVDILLGKLDINLNKFSVAELEKHLYIIKKGIK